MPHFDDNSNYDNSAVYEENLDVEVSEVYEDEAELAGAVNADLAAALPLDRTEENIKAKRLAIAEKYILTKAVRNGEEGNLQYEDVRAQAEELLKNDYFRNDILRVTCTDKVIEEFLRRKSYSDINPFDRLDMLINNPKAAENYEDELYDLLKEDEELESGLMYEDAFFELCKANDAVRFANPNKGKTMRELLNLAMDTEIEEKHDEAVEQLAKIKAIRENVAKLDFVHEVPKGLNQLAEYALTDDNKIQNDVDRIKMENLIGSNSPEGVAYTKEFISKMMNKALALPDEKLALTGDDAKTFLIENYKDLQVAMILSKMIKDPESIPGVFDDFNIDPKVCEALEHKSKLIEKNIIGELHNITLLASDEYRGNMLIHQLKGSEAERALKAPEYREMAKQENYRELFGAFKFTPTADNQEQPDAEYDNLSVEPDAIVSNKEPENPDRIPEFIDELGNGVDKGYIRSSEEFRRLRSTIIAIPEALSRCKSDADREKVYKELEDKAGAYLKYKDPTGGYSNGFKHGVKVKGELSDYAMERIRFANKVLEYAQERKLIHSVKSATEKKEASIIQEKIVSVYDKYTALKNSADKDAKLPESKELMNDVKLLKSISDKFSETSLIQIGCKNAMTALKSTVLNYGKSQNVDAEQLFGNRENAQEFGTAMMAIDSRADMAKEANMPVAEKEEVKVANNAQQVLS